MIKWMKKGKENKIKIKMIKQVEMGKVRTWENQMTMILRET